MYKFIALFLLFTSVCFGQMYPLFGTVNSQGAVKYVVSNDAAATINSPKTVNLVTDYRGLGDFLGLFTLTMDVDSVINTALDSFYVVSRYKIQGTWYTGDTLQWDRLDTSEIDATIIQTNKELILPDTHGDSLFVWTNDPTVTTNIQGIPAYEQFGIAILHKTLVDFNVTIQLGRH